MKIACFVLLALLPGAALAQGLPTGSIWEPVAHVTSADLAAQGWTVSEAAGVPLSNGQSAVVTYWEHRIYNTLEVMRCIASFDTDLNQTGEVCSRPMGGQSPS